MLAPAPPFSSNRAARSPRAVPASTAITRSPRSPAIMLPSATVIVVLPTPPLADRNATLFTPVSELRILASSSSRFSCLALGPGLIRPPVSRAISRRHPRSASGRRRRAANTSASRSPCTPSPTRSRCAGSASIGAPNRLCAGLRNGNSVVGPLSGRGPATKKGSAVPAPAMPGGPPGGGGPGGGGPGGGGPGGPGGGQGTRPCPDQTGGGGGPDGGGHGPPAGGAGWTAPRAAGSGGGGGAASPTVLAMTSVRSAAASACAMSGGPGAGGDDSPSSGSSAVAALKKSGAVIGSSILSGSASDGEVFIGKPVAFGQPIGQLAQRHRDSERLRGREDRLATGARFVGGGADQDPADLGVDDGDAHVGGTAGPVAGFLRGDLGERVVADACALHHLGVALGDPQIDQLGDDVRAGGDPFIQRDTDFHRQRELGEPGRWLIVEPGG